MLKERFTQLDVARDGVKQVAEEASKLTLRYIFPEEGTNNNDELGTPYQSVGSRGVNNLASKLLTTILPPDGGFFRYIIPEHIKVQLDPRTLTQVEDQIATAEKVTLQELSQISIRHPLFEALKHLLITGNVAVWLRDGELAVYDLRDFVVVRDKSQNLVEVILRESTDIDALDDDIREFVEENELGRAESQTENVTADEQNQTVTIYTTFKLNNGSWETYQEIEGEEVDDTRDTLDELPVYVLRYTNNIYGRGLIEQVLGDLQTLEALTKAITEGSLIAARSVFLVNPTGTTRPSKIAKAKNGDVVEGRPDDVGAMQVNKFADFRVAQERIAILEDRLNQIFLIFQPRNAERVTAEEIRRLTEELEALLGGVYSLLAEELQKPLIKSIYKKLKEEEKIPPFPEDIQVTITTGFEALSKTAALNKLFTMLQAVTPIPDALQYIQWDEYLSRILQSLNIEARGLVKSQQQIQQEQQQMMAQQAALQQQQGSQQPTQQ